MFSKQFSGRAWNVNNNPSKRNQQRQNAPGHPTGSTDAATGPPRRSTHPALGPPPGGRNGAIPAARACPSANASPNQTGPAADAPAGWPDDGPGARGEGHLRIIMHPRPGLPRPTPAPAPDGTPGFLDAQRGEAHPLGGMRGKILGAPAPGKPT